MLVESDDASARLAANDDDEELAFYQRAGREIWKLLQLVSLRKNLFPDHAALVRVETQ